jgi:SAM-dependent methyltransferase
MMNTLWQIVKPWAYMAVSIYYLIVTIIQLAAAGDIRTLQSWEAFNDTWFGNLWSFIGPRSRAEGEKWVAPLLEGRIKAGRVSYSGGGRPIDGVVLEIGAGSGMWTQVIADVTNAAKASSDNSAPAKIYGVEPNPISAAALKRRVEQVGLAGVYEVLPFGIEDLQKETSIKAGSVDCIMTVQCLCSIPEPEKNIRLLYEYLKPGGRWYVYEHVKAEQGLLLPLLQRTYQYGSLVK